MSGDVDMLGQMIMFGSLKSELCEFCGQKIFWAAALFSPALIAFRPTAGNIIVKISNCICQNHKIYFSKSQYNCSNFTLYLSKSQNIFAEMHLCPFYLHISICFSIWPYGRCTRMHWDISTWQRWWSEGRVKIPQSRLIESNLEWSKHCLQPPQVEKIFLDVKTALEQILKQTTWMDVETRNRWKMFTLAKDIGALSNKLECCLYNVVLYLSFPGFCFV